MNPVRLRALPGLVLLLLLALVPSPEAADPTTPGRKIGRTASSSVFSLFNLKPQSKFWTESVLRTEFDDLKRSASRDSSDKAALLNFTRAGNVANHMNLAQVDSIYFSIPVNFIFIGFDGKGGQEFKLGPEELERWFMKMDHVFEHTRIPPVGEVLAPFYKTIVKKLEHQYDLPLVSHVNHNVSVHAIHMGEDVMSIFEHAIKALSHSEDPREDGMPFWQVDSDQMEHVYSALVDHLQIQEAYSIFILNPKPMENGTRYGYRKGFSESEINLLRENKTLQAQILQSTTSHKQLHLDIEKGANKRPLYESHPLSSFSWTTTDNEDMKDWSHRCTEALRNLELVKAGKSKHDIVYDKAVQILHGAKDELHDVLKSALLSSDLKGLHAECLTDIWIGRDRFAFVDLSAGPFAWGPAVGGDGVRTELTLPNVAKTVGAVAEVTEEEAEESLQDTIRERFSSVGEDYHAVDILLAEIDVYELFAFKHCVGRRIQLALCKELEERMHDLKNELEGYNSGDSDEINKKKALDALKRMEEWNLFKETYGEHHSYTVARDSFLAHVGSTLWGSMRHVIAPSVSHRSYHYYEKLSFQLYFVTQENVRSIKQLPVNVKSITEGLSSLLLPSQKLMFTQHVLSLSEDPALMMAFSMARRAAAVPLLLVNGTYRSTVRTYLDSAILQHQLQKLSEQTSLRGGHSNHRSTLEVPIFWFIHSEPLILDKHYQAKALTNMVVVVQSDVDSWESHLQCNGRSILWDLRKPVKAAVAASAEYVSGLLPSHLVYSSAHETTSEDWTWSVGCNPLSVTSSQGWRLSQFQKDVIARNYIITAVEESVRVVNLAIQRLGRERTSERGFRIFKTKESVMVEKYNAVVNLWRRVAAMSKGLRYGDAVKLMSSLEDASNGFSHAVNSTVLNLHPAQCARERKLDIQLDLTTVPAFVAVFALLWFLLRPRRPKPKIN
ncbi:unnamed protein product [Alopecurus aequalis]